MNAKQRQRAEEALINYARNIADEDDVDFSAETHHNYLRQFSDAEIKYALGQVGLTYLLEE